MKPQNSWKPDGSITLPFGMTVAAEHGRGRELARDVAEWCEQRMPGEWRFVADRDWCLMRQHGVPLPRRTAAYRIEFRTKAHAVLFRLCFAVDLSDEPLFV